MRRAFTLIELLVVIAIIAILAAILFPVFAQAKAMAKQTACISNMKQMTLGALAYMGEQDDRVMPRYECPPQTGCVDSSYGNYANGNLWSGTIYPFIKNRPVYLDPAAQGSQYSERWVNRGEPSIGQNATISGWYWAATGEMILTMQSEMQAIAKTVMFANSYWGPTANGYRGYLARNDALNVIGLSISDRHHGGTVHSFFDGHAKWFKAVAVLGNPNAPYQCDDTSVYTGLWWLDKNAAKIKWNVTDPCVGDPE